MRKILISCLLVVAMTALTVMAEAPRAKGTALQPGDTIGIAAPASPDDGLDAASAVHVLQAMGYKTVMAPNVRERDGFFAGTDKDRAAGVNALFANEDVKAVVCLNGGYGSARILDKLDYAMIAKHPKLLIGFSDITALHTALGEKAGIVTVHGPMMITLAPSNHSAYTAQQFSKGVATTEPIGRLSLPPGKNLQTIVAGTAQGRLAGGNLTMLAAAVGTPYELKGDGAILVLEDVNEDAYRIDRMMQQLWQNGLLKRVHAIVYGDFLNCRHDPGDFTTDEVLTYYAKLSGKPAVRGLPMGHGMDNAFLPLGVHAIVCADADGTATLTIDERHNREAQRIQK
jgi:muramoyltetrapeptide carboxypeptidase